jgi:amino acid adenylation domain-containing protein
MTGSSEVSVAECFERVVRAYSGRLALKGKRRELTYGELNSNANQIARAIHEQAGDDRGATALLFTNGTSPVVSILAVLKLGRMYVPLDRRLPQARLTFMLEDSQAGAIVTDSAGLDLAHDSARGAVPIINVDALDAEVADTNLKLGVSPDSPGCLYYTSGSSGQPKGVVHTHRNMVFEASVRARALQIGMDDRMACFHTIGAFVSMTTILSALLYGASLYPLDVRELGAEDVLAWLGEHAITMTSVRLVMPQLFPASIRDEMFPNLRVVSFGADAFHSTHIEWAREKFSPDIIRIGFACTETGAISQLLIYRGVEIPQGMMPAGYAVKGKEVLLLDETGQVVGEGEVGEIGVRSYYLSAGYWRRPELSRTRFLPDPEGGDNGIYLTGDLGRRLPDGCLVHLGRKDQQVKIRGYRVETGEVERVLVEVGTIREAVVVGHRQHAEAGRPSGTISPLEYSGDRRLVAYLVSDSPSPPPTVTSLRRKLERKLPDYMVPSAYVFLDALPRTATGKVDRQALPPPGRSRPELEMAYVAPRSPTEERLAGIWAELLDLDRVGVHDDFFELGGHSILVMQVLSRMREKLHVELPLGQIFETPTIAGLAPSIKEARNSTRTEAHEIKSISRRSHRRGV